MIEVVERYSSMLPPRAECARETDACGPAELAFRDRFPPGLRSWYRGVDLDGGLHWVPEDLVDLAGAMAGRGPSCDSTGIAAQRTKELAIAAAVLELVERARAATVLSDIVEVRLDLETMTPVCSTWARSCTSLGYRLTIVPCSPGMNPAVVIALAHQFEDPTRPSLIIASAASSDPEAAIEHALAELHGNLLVGVELFGEAVRSEIPDAHQRYWRIAEARALWDALGLARARTIPLRGLRHDERESATRPSAITMDRGNVLTDALGLHVYQAWIPTLWPPSSPLSGASGLPHPMTITHVR